MFDRSSFDDRIRWLFDRSLIDVRLMFHRCSMDVRSMFYRCSIDSGSVFYGFSIDVRSMFDRASIVDRCSIDIPLISIDFQSIFLCSIDGSIDLRRWSLFDCIFAISSLCLCGYRVSPLCDRCLPPHRNLFPLHQNFY